MTRFNSVSDLARSYQLRLSQTSLKTKLDTLSQESTSGVKADIASALQGDLGRISQIESRLTMLKTYGNNLSEAQSLFSGMQDAATAIQALASKTGPVLVSDALTSSDPTLQVHLRKAPDELRAVLSALNTTVAGRSAFSGSRTDQAAVVGYDDLIAQLTAAVGGATTAAAITTAINGYFDSPAGAGGFADIGYLGDDNGTTSISVAPDKALGSDLTANSGEFRAALKGFAILAFAAEATTLDSQTLRDLSRAAGGHLVSGRDQLSLAMAGIGQQEEQAAKFQTANAAESSAMTLARNGLIAADPYETATALKEIQANIETLYTLTSRLSSLTLTDYL